jgi:hypothetical protein
MPLRGKGSHVESLEEVEQLRDAIDRNDITGVQNLMTRNPGLHKARLGLWQRRPADARRRMPSTDGIQTLDSAMDDRERIRCPSGRGRTANARGAFGNRIR